MKQLINKSSIDAMPEGVSLVDTKIDGFVAKAAEREGVVRLPVRGKDHKQWWLSLGVHGQSGVTADNVVQSTTIPK